MPAMPIGYRGRFYDEIASILFDIDGTPLDAFTGRALSLTAAQLFKPIDPYYPFNLYQPSSGSSTGASVRTLLRRAFGTDPPGKTRVMHPVLQMSLIIYVLLVLI